ncbi:hypothetical protein ACFW1M_16455, partial [Streptomyces inhibens]
MLRRARADDPGFRASADKRGAELPYGVGDFKRYPATGPAPPPVPRTCRDAGRARRGPHARAAAV